MENICGFFDTVGFNLKSGFIPCEISLLSENGASVISVNHGFKYKNLTPEDKKTIQDEQYENGLPFTDRNGLRPSRIPDVLDAFYEVNCDKDRFLIGYCTPEAEELLRLARIPRYNLAKHTVDWSKLCRAYSSPQCFLHSHKVGKRCAFTCVNSMQQWVFHMLKPRTPPGKDVCGFKRLSLAGYDVCAHNTDCNIECDCPYGCTNLEEIKDEK